MARSRCGCVGIFRDRGAGRQGGRQVRCALRCAGAAARARARRRLLMPHAWRCRAYFLHTGDASGPNLGPLTAEELEGLRGVTLAQFAAVAKATRAKFAKGSSAFHGVSWNKSKSKWQAFCQNTVTGKQENLGYFEDEAEAARAYDKCVATFRGAAPSCSDACFLTSQEGVRAARHQGEAELPLRALLLRPFSSHARLRQRRRPG